jgi:hypothetical protein
MAEDNDFTPGAWKGHNFRSARAAYSGVAQRSYTAAKQSNKKALDMVPDSISTESTSPLCIMVDVTGSMGPWPQTIFSKLPYLDIEGKVYLGADMEISFAANTDLNDSYPLQIRDFHTGTVLKDELAEFVLGGGGGPDSGCEAYELGAQYYATNCKMPNAVKPIFIFVADEQPHKTARAAMAKAYAKVDSKDMTIDQVFDALKAKFEVFLVHKQYSPASREEWVRLLGESRIADLQEPERVVDVIFGILARVTGRVGYFRTEIEGRQNAGQVSTVYKALDTIHRVPAASQDAPGAKSTMHKPSGGKAAKSLL